MTIDERFAETSFLNNLNGVESALATGTFTPVVGAACSTLDCDDEPRKELGVDVQRKLMALAAYIKKTAAEDSEADVEHLHQLVDIDSAFSEDPLPLNPTMAALLHTLLRVDRFACTFFHDNRPRITENNRISLWKTRDDRRVRLPRYTDEWEVPFGDRPEASSFRLSLDGAIRAAQAAQKEAQLRDARPDDLQADWDWSDLGLGAGAIQDQLTGFRNALFGCAESVGKPSLTLPDLVWLGHLLWHVLRFDLRYYPTSAELAFQLSLHSNPGIGNAYDREVPSLAQAAQMVADPLKHLTRWFTYYNTNKTPSHLYNTLAEWLVLTFNRHRTTAATRGKLAVPLPVILTTNYDRAIENALDAKHSSYHVLIPISYIFIPKDANRSKENRHSIWLLKSRYRENKQWVTRWNYGGCANARFVRSDIENANLRKTLQRVEGPLVIKLHGSPLESLPDSKVGDLPETLSEVDDDYRYEHRIVISESDYLRDLRDDLPDQIRDLLSDGNRVLVFMGQSIADWNIRVRLADHVRWSSPGGGGGDYDAPPYPQVRFAINKKTRRFDTGIMGRLHINVIWADLQKIPTLLENQSKEMRDAR